MLRYTSPPPTPPLALHVRYKASDSPGILVGFIEEVRGIVVQATTVEELFQDVAKSAAYMLRRYKRAEAFALLREQGHHLEDVGQDIAFTLFDGPPFSSPF